LITPVSRVRRDLWLIALLTKFGGISQLAII